MIAHKYSDLQTPSLIEEGVRVTAYRYSAVGWCTCTGCLVRWLMTLLEGGNKGQVRRVCRVFTCKPLDLTVVTTRFPLVTLLLFVVSEQSLKASWTTTNEEILS